MRSYECLIVAMMNRFLSAFPGYAESSNINKNMLAHVLVLVNILAVYWVCSRLVANVFCIFTADILQWLCCLILQPNILLPGEIHQQFLRTAKRHLKKWFCWKTNLLIEYKSQKMNPLINSFIAQSFIWKVVLC